MNDDADPHPSDADLSDPAPWIAAKPQAIKGRGAVSNILGRFETQRIEAVDDGWQRPQDDSDIAPALRTSVTAEYAKTILSRNQSPDLPFSVSLNPYRGCEHGCVYCYARPSHAYLGLSPGLDFETRLYAKHNAPELLRQELAANNYQPQPIAFGMNTDAYQPCERELRLTRRCLEVLHECQHPVGLVTKSALIERDIDILQDMARNHLATVALTITTLDHSVARTLEPRAASPTRRLQAMEKLAKAGIPVLVNVAPIIPFVTEHELENVLQAAANAGATAAGYTVLRLPWEVNPLFQEWLQSHFPERAQRVMNRIRDMRGGKDYDASFTTRMRGEGLWADVIRQRFANALKRYSLNKSGSLAYELDCSQFRKPRYIPSQTTKPTQHSTGQLDFFG